MLVAFNCAILCEMQMQIACAGYRELSADWVVGFVDGEGCFFIGIQKNPTIESGFRSLPEFRVRQHQRDLDLLHDLKKFFAFGRVCRIMVNAGSFVSGAFKFARKHFFRAASTDEQEARRCQQVRRSTANDGSGRHLTIDGLGEIKRIAITMNTGRRPRLGL